MEAICWFRLSLTVLFICCIGYGNGLKQTTDIRTRPLWNQTQLDKLKKDLLTNYDKYARPEEHDRATDVKVGMAILNVETEESKALLAVTCWMRLVWNDTKLQWNESDYGGLSVIRISDHEIWQPDIFLYNSASGAGQLPSYGNLNLLVYPNGEVLWVPSVKLISLCDFNMRYWPFDVQHCYLQFGSWVYNGNEIFLGLYNNKNAIDLESSIGMSEWKIETTSELKTKIYDCCEEKYYSAMFNLTLTRKTVSYSATILAPAVVSAFFILLQFWLPPDASEKIFLNGFAIVILNMYLIYLNNKVLGVGSQTPLIVSFFSSCLYIVTFTTLNAIIVFCFTRTQKTHPVPQILKKFLQSKLGRLIYLEFELPQICNGETTTGATAEGNSSTQQEWHVLSVIVDRLFFLLCSVLFLTLSIIVA